jgi:hypothetical protein
MAIPSSGPISLSALGEEFVQSLSLKKMSNLYKADVGVPASGEIKFSNFYGTNRHASKSVSAAAINANVPGTTEPFLLGSAGGVNEQNSSGTFTANINRWGSVTNNDMQTIDPVGEIRNTTRNTILAWYVGTGAANVFSSTLTFNGTAAQAWTTTSSTPMATSVSAGTGTGSRIHTFYPDTDVKWKDYTTNTSGLSISVAAGGGIVETAWYRAIWMLPNKWIRRSVTVSPQNATVLSVSVRVPSKSVLVTNHANGPDNIQTVNMSTCGTLETSGTAGPNIAAIFEQRGITWYKGVGAALFVNSTPRDLDFVIPTQTQVNNVQVQNAMHAVVLDFQGDGYLNSV